MGTIGLAEIGLNVEQSQLPNEHFRWAQLAIECTSSSTERERETLTPDSPIGDTEWPDGSAPLRTNE